MGKVRIILDIDPELADENDRTGLTEAAYIQLLDALTNFGDVDEGPERVDS